jgi:hypothetical protein
MESFNGCNKFATRQATHHHTTVRANLYTSNDQSLRASYQDGFISHGVSQAYITNKVLSPFDDDRTTNYQDEEKLIALKNNKLRA